VRRGPVARAAPTPLRVLLVEDSESDAMLVARALRATGREIRVERVETADAMRTALARTKFDAVISDWNLPAFDATAALAVLHESQADLPFIIVSGAVGEEVAVDAMRSGAHDYVRKDNLARLAPALERELRDREIREARRAAEDELRMQATRFRALIERSDEGIALTDRDARLLYASPGARRILGFGEAEPAGRPIGDSVHPDDRAHVATVGARVRATALTAESLEFRIVRPDGATRWLEVTLVNRLDDPAVAAVVANFRDITDRKRALDELHESETRFRRLWESGVVGIAIEDAAGGYVEANDALLQMVGYTREELLDGKVPWGEMTPPEWNPTTEAAREQLRLVGSARPWEKEYLRKDGTRAPVLVGVATLPGERSISVVVDLSARKAAEDDRRRAEHALHVTESHLRQAQKMEAIGRLAGGVAHDFNNILSVILSYGELALAELKDGDPMRDDIQEVCKAGRRAADLTSQLLMFSRQQVLEPTIVGLNDLLANMNKMLRRVLGEDVDLVSIPGPALGFVRVDRSSIEQAVMNLAVNARDAMPVGGRLTLETRNVDLDEVFVRAHVGVRPGAHVLLAVTDTGSGMDDATQAHMFEPFFTTKGIGKGTGLGLSTVFGIVQQSGGTIAVDSAPGRGTTFNIYLPRVAAEVTRERPTVPPTALRGSETILLVEDEVSVRAVARGILQRFGYRVMEARDADDAIGIAASHNGKIELLLTDVVMPQMSGPALARRIMESRPEMRVLCMSGYTDDSVVRHGVLASEIAYLQKPITPDLLARKVREVLDVRPTCP